MGIGRHNHKVGFNPGLCEHLAHFVLDVFNISLGHDWADDADGVIAPLAVLFEHEGQRQHQLDIFGGIPPEIDGAHRNINPFLFLLSRDNNETAPHLLDGVDALIESCLFLGVLAPPQQDGVGPHTTNPVALKKRLDGGVEVFFDDDDGKGGGRQ
ncbi:MAG: hypothetical protein R6V60_12705 [Desulfobacterales bacterium]